ncbi:MAG: sensor histidine kinase [Niabella sp.]|nr:MAG: sensor histidine kinase [Niabella sp.]
MSIENDKYQEVYFVIIFGVLVFFALVAIIVIAILKSNQRRFQYEKEKADLQSNFDNSLLQSKIEIQEQAFNDIGRELHDNLGQHLSLAKLNLSTLKEINNPQDRNKIEVCIELIKDSIFQIRSISRTLLGEKISSIGMVEAIKIEVERINKTGILSVTFTEPNFDFISDAKKETILFRIVQEALNNVIKHSDAKKASIEITSTHTKHKIIIQDNGKGFNLGGSVKEGIGLMNMKNRAQTVGAEIIISSAIGVGTRIELLIAKP